MKYDSSSNEQSLPLIWVIDDSSVVRVILETALRREGMRVQCFKHGREVLHYLYYHPQTPAPALVLVDLLLPYMHGYVVMKTLKRKPLCAASTFFIISRRDGMLDRLLGRLAGASEHIPKPLKTAQIVELVKTYLRRGQPPPGLLAR